MRIRIATAPTTVHVAATRVIEEFLPNDTEIEFACENQQCTFGMLDMGLQLPGPCSSVNCVKLKLNNSGLASGSMPGRCRSIVRVTGNFTLLPKLASSVSFFFPGARSIMGVNPRV